MDNILKSKQYYQNFISILDILLNEILSQYCQPLFTMEVEGDVAKKSTMKYKVSTAKWLMLWRIVWSPLRRNISVK